jgi:hypothetical protein
VNDAGGERRHDSRNDNEHEDDQRPKVLECRNQREAGNQPQAAYTS